MKLDVHIALLRGINVGGHNKLPMKRLAAIFEAAGCERVRTYIQSGNVLFAASAAVARRVPPSVSKAIEDEFGYKIPLVLRTAAELAEAARAHPFAAPGVEDRELHVAFLAAAPDAARVAALDADRSPPDQFVVRGRDIYLRFPKGLARSKLTNAYFDAKLGTVSTVRNWNTTRKLAEMAQG